MTATAWELLAVASGLIAAGWLLAMSWRRSK